MSPIYGIIAQDNALAPSAPSLPDPLAVADFVNGIYTIGASTVALTQVVDHTGYISGGTGMVFTAGQPVANVIGGFRTLMLTQNWTCVFDLNFNPNLGANIYIFYTLTPSFGYENYIQVFGWYEILDNNSDYGPALPAGSGSPVSRDAYDSLGTTIYNTGVHRFAVTRTDSMSSVSIDGSAVTGTMTETAALTFDLGSQVDTTLGGFTTQGGSGNINQTFTLKKWSIYDPVDNATLAALSA